MSAGEESVEKSAFGIGWEFVQTYYTVMHKEPEELYKFYGNNSYLCNAVEGESTPYCHGKDVKIIYNNNNNNNNNKIIIIYIFILYYIKINK